MSAPRTRRRPRRPLERAGDRIDRAGQSILLALWRACARVLRLLLASVDRGWIIASRQTRPVQAAVLAAAAIAFLAFYPRDQPLRVSSDAEALARVIRSEAGTGTLQQRVHIAWATRNLADERGQSVAELACSPCGPQQRGRPVSSRQAPLDSDRQLARQILAAPAMLDPTGGATHFINPSLQDRLAARGRSGYRGRPYRVVRRRWIRSYGWRPYYRLGDDLELWGPPRSRGNR